jgi:hypothetical protein
MGWGGALAERDLELEVRRPPAPMIGVARVANGSWLR